jgi:hypothetical protein
MAGTDPPGGPAHEKRMTQRQALHHLLPMHADLPEDRSLPSGIFRQPLSAPDQAERVQTDSGRR